MTEPSRQLGIVELAGICALMRTRNLELFEQLGGWIVDTADPNLQRLFTEATHRHAWHADLWAQRAPAISPTELDTSIATPPLPVFAPIASAAVYAEQLDRMQEDLRQLMSRIDVLLDPSTTRTIRLVIADLTDLRQRLDPWSSAVPGRRQSLVVDRHPPTD